MFFGCADGLFAFSMHDEMVKIKYFFIFKRNIDTENSSFCIAKHSNQLTMDSYPSDSYSPCYSCFIQRIFIRRIAIHRIGDLSIG